MVGVIDFGSKKVPNIVAVLDKLGFETKIFLWNECDEKSLKKMDSIILSGAPILLTEIDYKHYIKKFIFLKTMAVPILGICFGHQLLGLLFGSKVYKGEAVSATTDIEILNKAPLFNGLTSKLKMMEDHTEGITLPQNFTCIARSEKYEVEAMKHVSKLFYGVQFHPEVSGENGEKLLRNFLSFL